MTILNGFEHGIHSAEDRRESEGAVKGSGHGSDVPACIVKEE